MRAIILATGALLSLSAAAMAQSGPTQSRDGLSTASQGKGVSNNSLPSGSVNATTGPQSRPAYPSGSTSANPGAAFVGSSTPKPATGAAAQPPGVTKTTTVGGGGATQTASPGVGQAATPPR